VRIFVEREEWYFRIFGERTIDETQEKCRALSDFGLLYFCVIFLSKPYAKRLIEETGLLAPENSPFKDFENDIVREMMSIYRIRMTRGKRLDSNDTETALAMDMLNELRKCPLPLFDVLSKDGQDFFTDEVEGTDNTLQEKVKRYRATDRFPHLVLRYIDTKKLFETIRFQVELGKFRFRFYEKTGVDGEKRMRTLQKEINGFGRLQEIEELRKKEWADMLQQSELTDVKLEDNETVLQLLQFSEDSADSKPYVTDHHASYNISDNRIGMYWNASPSDLLKNGVYLPQLKSENGKALVEQPCPKASMSVYDLPALSFYLYLLHKNNCTDTFPSPEKIIKTTYNHLRNFFKDFCDGKVKRFDTREQLADLLKNFYHGIQLSWIPDKLLDYLLSRKKISASKQFNQNSITILEERKARLKQRLVKFNDDKKAIGTKNNNYAKKGFAEIRYSQLAKYIAESLMEWQPASDNGRNKLTGQNFNVLVAFLATYHSGKPISELTELLRKAGLLGGQDNHPFIQDVLNLGPKDIEALYQRYLEKEIDYLNKCLQGAVEKKKIPFLHANRRKWQPRDERYYRELAGRYLQMGEDGKSATIMLPDGLFTQYILQLLKDKYANYETLMLMLQNEDGSDEADDKTRNAAYLISRFFEIVRGDNGQPYYLTQKANGEKTRFARTYDVFNILNNEKKRNSLVPIYVSTDEINERLTCKKDGEKCIEKEIRVFLNSMTGRDKGNHKTLQEAKEAMDRTLHKAIRFCKNNERAIRRYKTQDMVLFLMAQNLLQEIIPDNEMVNDRNFMLKKVCEEGFLSQAVRMEKTFEVDIKGKKKSFCVVQENMSLKNYGEFYRLINDERLLSLLEQLSKCGEISHADLHSELAQYDQGRSSVFGVIQNIEKLISDTFPELSNPDSEGFFVEGKTVPKLNNFRSLLGLLEQADCHQLDEKEKKMIISIRNAFSHNTYRINLHEAMPQEKIELPNVAYLIFKLMNDYYTKITGK
ncbi:MAG: type VI-B CRISPR-associated RNA-guided ribonuclease Cas13b, partial [Prevotella sp.]|nr:type VI-B CRISPR-associated RNA-guided ribonuclease Cas13b [Prevotella sp.]